MEKINIVEAKAIMSRISERRVEDMPLTGGLIEDIANAISWIINSIITIYEGIVYIINHVWIIIGLGVITLIAVLAKE